MSGKKRKLSADDLRACKRIRTSSSKHFVCEAWTLELMRLVDDIVPIAVIILEFSCGDWISCHNCGEVIDLVTASRECPLPGHGMESYCDECVWPGTFSYWKLTKGNVAMSEYLFDTESEGDDNQV